MPDQNQAPQPARGADEQAGPNDLVKAVDKLLNEIGPRFDSVAKEIFTKMDEMGKRLDDMEAAINASNDAGASGRGAE